MWLLGENKIIESVGLIRLWLPNCCFMVIIFITPFLDVKYNYQNWPRHRWVWVILSEAVSEWWIFPLLLPSCFLPCLNWKVSGRVTLPVIMQLLQSLDWCPQKTRFLNFMELNMLKNHQIGTWSLKFQNWVDCTRNLFSRYNVISWLNLYKAQP